VKAAQATRPKRRAQAGCPARPARAPAGADRHRAHRFGAAGQPNWSQTGGLHQGLYSYRYMLADANPKPSIELVRI
jgi:hypothetical protein